MTKVSKIVETCVYGRDLAAMKRFYSGVIGLEPVQEEEGKFVFFKAGKSMLLVFNPERTFPDNNRLPPHGSTGPSHFAMEMQDAGDHTYWKERLRANNVEIETEVGWKEKSKSLYFRDPAGNLVELITPGEWPVDDD
ncbi:MAG: glyoxalase/bleomycin resistance/extradiol dioxygenase family protein [Nitrososphaera sp.]